MAPAVNQSKRTIVAYLEKLPQRHRTRFAKPIGRKTEKRQYHPQCHRNGRPERNGKSAVVILLHQSGKADQTKAGFTGCDTENIASGNSSRRQKVRHAFDMLLRFAGKVDDNENRQKKNNPVECIHEVSVRL